MIVSTLLHRLWTPVRLFLVAPLTRFRILYAERHAEAMTGTTEFPLIHLFHNPAFAGATGWHDAIMAVTAVIPPGNMRLVAEIYIAGICRKLVSHSFKRYRVTFLAVPLDTESSFLIMAIAAGFPLLHLQHTEIFVARARNIYVRVAIFATVSCYMHKMAEYGTPRTEVYLFDSMTFLTVGFDSESTLLIVASSA